MKLHSRQQHIVDVYGKHPESFDEIAEACLAVINNRDTVAGFAWNIHYDPRVSNSHSAPINGRTNWGGTAGPNVPCHYPGMYGRVWIRYAETPKESFGSSGNFHHTLTHTGSGGGGAYEGPWRQICSSVYRTRIRRTTGRGFEYKYPEPKCYSWDYRLYLSDWPGIRETIYKEILEHERAEDQAETWHKLKGKYYSRKKFELSHKFIWENPATKVADEKFIDEYLKTVDDPSNEFKISNSMLHLAW